jgi:thioredoxin 1
MNNTESFQAIINSSQPVLVDFYANWCGPCKAMNPVIKEVAQHLKGKARVIKVDIDQAQDAAIKFGVQAVPTFMLFKNGKILWRHSGMIDRHALLRTIQQVGN